MKDIPSHRVCLAPMLKITDRHFRYLMRLLSSHMFLYTEMIAAPALLHGDTKRFLEFSDEEYPVAIQLGSGDPSLLRQCARLAENAGYDEINLNVGCPSPRVQSGNFGACLMKTPELVSDCVNAMASTVNIPVSVKMRTGIGKEADYEYLKNFISMVSSAGCKLFIIHARNVWFDIKRPKENRNKPQIRYEMVYDIKKYFPDLEIIVNGDIESLNDGLKHCDHVDGIMVGRLPFLDPYKISKVDQLFYEDDHDVSSRFEIIEKYIEYMETQPGRKRQLPRMARHLLNIFNGEPNATQWRRYLSDNVYKRKGEVISVIREAIKKVSGIR